MKITAIDEIPRPKKRLQALIEKFYKSEIKVGRVEWTSKDYKNAKVAYSVLWSAAKRSKLPVSVAKRGEEVYLYRTTVSYIHKPYNYKRSVKGE